jgi:polysaccharide export outer membrane protein
MLKKSLLALALLTASGCGVVYISPQVTEADGKVRIIPITGQSVLAANRAPYNPKALPSVFFQNAGGGSGLRGAGATPEPGTSQENRPAALPLRTPPPAEPGPYRIGVGDVLLLATKTGGNTVAELSGLLAAQNQRQGYTVQDDGAIAIPDVGRVPLAGLTLEEAEAQLFQSLVQNQIDPSFSLEIAEFNSKRVAVGGAVSNPTVVPVTLTPLYLDEALAATGGVSARDLDFVTIRIYRDGALYQVPLTDYLGQPGLQKIRLVEGDSVFVDTEFELEKAQAYFAEQIRLAEFRQNARVQALSELQAEVNLRRAALAESRTNFESQVAFDAVDRDFVYLTGEVGTPSRYALPFGRQASLADALYSEGGGFDNETGNPAQIYVLRGSNNPAEFGAVTAWNLNARQATNFILATQFELRPNDVIFIAEQPVTRWSRVINQISPSLITTPIIAAND